MKTKTRQWRTDKRKKPRKPKHLRLEATYECMFWVGELIYWHRLSRESRTKPNLGYLTRAELARMATLHLDKKAPPISGATIKALEEEPSTLRTFRLIAVLSALGYSATLHGTK